MRIITYNMKGGITMVDYEITKKVKLLEVNNDMCHNYYFLVYGKIYNEGKTRYRKFKYVEWFDIFDVQEYFEDENGNCDGITNDDIKEYLNELIYSGQINFIKDYNDEKSLKEFYDYCNETIKNYNRINRGNYYEKILCE